MRKFRSSFFILHSSLFTDRRLSFILHSSFFILTSFFILHSSFFTTGCTSSTQPKTGSLSGRVILVNDTDDPSLDPVDFSGVTVALYELAVLDTTITRINREYPSIGVQISQETEFDHRDYNPVAVVQTNEAGDFMLTEITHGIYNLVVFKEAWSIRYVYQVLIDKEENQVYNSTQCKSTSTKSDEIKLYPVYMLPSYINYPLTLKEDRVYIVSQNTIAISNVIVESRTKILVASNKKIDFHGTVSSPIDGSYWLISALDGVYSTNLKDEIASFDQVGFFDDSPLFIRNIVYEHSLNGIRFDSNQVSMNDCIVRSNQNNAILFNGANSAIQNSIVKQNPQKAITAFFHFDMMSSIVHSNRDACFLSESTSVISNNFFSDNYIAIRTFYGVITIENNCFDRNDNAISPSASNPIIMENNFYQNIRDVELNGYYTHQDVDYCNPIIESNNFFGNGWYIHLKGSNSVYADGEYLYNGVNQNQVYPDNYLKASDLVPHVFDSNNPNSNNFPHAASFSPRRSTPNPESGLQ